MLKTSIFCFLVTLISLTRADDAYTVESYPNPQKGGYEECGLRSAGYVCDPLQILSESERYRINHQLVSFANNTEENGVTYCTKRGTIAMFVILDKASQAFTDALRKKWRDMDSQCEKFGILLLSLEDRRIYGSFDEHSPISMIQLQAIIATEENNIRTGSYTTAVTHILKEAVALVEPQKWLTTRRPEATTRSSSVHFSVISFFATFLMFICI